MTKTTQIVKLALLLIICFSLSAIPAFANTPALQLTFLNQDPDPVGPGEYVDLKFRLDNLGQGSAENIEVTFIESYPFSLDPGVSPSQVISSLGPLQGDDTGVVIDYRVRVASDAAEGVNELELKFTAKGQKERSVDFDVEIKTQDSGLSVGRVAADQLIPGNANSVEITLDNPSDNTLREISVSLDLITDDLPFAPANSAATKTLRILRSGESSVFTFDLVPFPDAESKVYRIPVSIQYFDATNQLVEKSDIIGVVVGSDVELEVYADSERFTSNMPKGTVTLNFINKGLGDIKFLDVKVKDTDEYSVTSTANQYIGNVDSDDFENEDFMIKKNGEITEFTLVAEISYRDANNKAFNEDISIPITLYDAPEQSSGSGLWIFIVIIVIGFFVFRYFRKRKKK